MKHFRNAKVQIISVDEETEEKYSLTLGNLVEDADAATIVQVAEALDTVIDGYLDYATVVESFHISL